MTWHSKFMRDDVWEALPFGGRSICVRRGHSVFQSRQPLASDRSPPGRGLVRGVRRVIEGVSGLTCLGRGVCVCGSSPRSPAGGYHTGACEGEPRPRGGGRVRFRGVGKCKSRIWARTGAVGASGCGGWSPELAGIERRGCGRWREPRWTQSWSPGSRDRPGGWAWAEGAADSAVWPGQAVWEGSVFWQAPWLRLRGWLWAWERARWPRGQGQRWPAKQCHAVGVGGEAGCVDRGGPLRGASFCVGLLDQG